MSEQNGVQKIQQRLEALEIEISGKQQERRELLKEIAGEQVQDYELKDWSGSTIRLSEMFGDKSELMLIHNMGRSCPYCTLWADGFNGVTGHLNNRLAFGVVSPNSPEVQKEFAESRGWTFTMYSAEGSTFTRDLGYEIDHEGQPYQLPGVSVFTKDADGTITRVSRDFFGPGDPYSAIWHLLDLLPNGPNDWHPKFSYAEKMEEAA